MSKVPLQDYIYDGHGHSVASDGSNTPEELLEVAYKLGINILGLSDHNTTKSLPKFIEHSKIMNSQGRKILIIPSLEQSTQEGDVILLVPDLQDAQRFIQDYRKPSSRPHIIDCIEQHIEKYNGLIIIPHPNCRFISSVSHELLSSLVQEQLPKRYLPHIGIEVFNWMSQVFFWERPQTEQKLREFVKNHNLAQTGGTDYHSSSVIGSGRTIMRMQQLSADCFFDAFTKRSMTVERSDTPTLHRLKQLIIESLRAEVNSKFTSRDFRIPH